MRIVARSPLSVPFPPPCPHSPPPPLRLLRLLAPPRAPLPPDLAANIVRKDKYVGDQTGGVEAC